MIRVTNMLGDNMHFSILILSLTVVFVIFMRTVLRDLPLPLWYKRWLGSWLGNYCSKCGGEVEEVGYNFHTRCKNSVCRGNDAYKQYKKRSKL